MFMKLRVIATGLPHILTELTLAVCCFAEPEAVGPLTEMQVRKNRHVAVDAPKYATYAILSDNAYARNIPLPLPPGWTKVKERRLPENGLALTVYELRANEKLAEVVVAFCGTDESKDWIQNLAPFYRIQVPPAEKMFSDILTNYKDSGARIVVTGHSLGGGLAFHMSFVHHDVEAIVFNSSPVTKAGMKVLKNKRTSIWESGEGLQAPRNVVNFARVRWRGVKRVEVRFLHGSPVRQHSMTLLALNLTKLAALGSPEHQALLETYRQNLRRALREG